MGSTGESQGLPNVEPPKTDTRFAAPFKSNRPGSRTLTTGVLPEQGEESDGDGRDREGSMKSTALALEAAGMKAAKASGRTPDDRRKGRRRSRTIPMRQLTREEILSGAELTDLMAYERPKTRGECVGGVRPCPFVSCRHHLYLEVSERTGSIKLNFPDAELGELIETCALDVADRGGATLEEIGEMLNLTRERIRQLEAKGMEKLREVGFHESFAGVLEERE
jgi:hypothetical protein